MRPALIIGVVALLAAAVAAPAEGATQLRQVQVPISGPGSAPPTPAGTLTLDFVFQNKRTSKRKFTPRRLTRIDFSKVPLACMNDSGQAASVLLFTSTMQTAIKLTKVPSPGGKKPKPGRFAFRFSYSFPTFTGTLRGTIDKPNHGPRRLRSQGALTIEDLDSNPGHTNCSTQGPKQWGGLPVTRIQ